MHPTATDIDTVINVSIIKFCGHGRLIPTKHTIEVDKAQNITTEDRKMPLSCIIALFIGSYNSRGAIIKHESIS